MGEALSWLKLAIALGGALAAFRLLRGRSTWATALLVGCALLAGGAYFELGQRREGYVHRWEMFHYYVGSKYHRELGYERLYRCALVAESELLGDKLKPRPLRDLHTDQVIGSQRVLEDPSACKAHFSAARWRELQGDVRAFRRLLGPRAWARSQLDHGYNPPPLWSATWGWVANQVPLDLRHLKALAAIDWLLMLGTLVALAYGFGYRTALIGVVFWGTQAASELGWTGGGFARQDWLFACVLGVVLLRKHHFAAAGAALMLATSLRLFPAVLLVGPALIWGVRSWRERCIPRAARRFIAGASVSAVLSLGLVSARGELGDHVAFWQHIQLRHDAIVNNHMGLRTLLSAAPIAVASNETSTKERGAPRWVDERRERLEQLQAPRIAVLAASLLLIGVAMARSQRAWVGAALGTLLVPLLTDPACYYYSFFLLLAPLTLTRRSLGVLLCVVAAGGQFLVLAYAAPTERFVALSWLYVAVTLVVALSFARISRPRWASFEGGGSKCNAIV